MSLKHVALAVATFALLAAVNLAPAAAQAPSCGDKYNRVMQVQVHRAAPAAPAYAQIAAAAPGPTARRALTASQFPYLDSAPPHTAACIGEMI